MNVSTEFVNWLLIGGAAVFGLAMGGNYLLLICARRANRKAREEAGIR